MMKRLTLSAREQKLALVAGVIFLVGLVIWLGFPLVDRLEQLRQEAQVSQGKISRLRALMARAPAIEDAHQRYTQYWTDEPDEGIQSVFLDELERLAREGGLQISLKPRPVRHESNVTRLGVEVDVDATQDSLLAFLDRLFGWPRLIELERLRISATASKQFPLRATVLINRVVVRN